MSRLSTAVAQELLDEMNRIVISYPVGVERTAKTVEELIGGTACFPGGSGLWRGDCYRGPLLKLFPESPVMFIGHNFDSIEAHDQAMEQGGEVATQFWKTLKAFLRAADNLNPAECFFTNALMGLKPGTADGPMPDCDGYRLQCQRFLRRQIDIVRPRSIIILGGDAEDQLRKARRLDAAGAAIQYGKAMHPSTRPRNQRPTREQWILAQGKKIASEVAGATAHYASAGSR